MRWFRNIRSGQPFDPGQISLDYSLQLAQGIENFFEVNRARRVCARSKPNTAKPSAFG
jgi:hypothetical protein